MRYKPHYLKLKKDRYKLNEFSTKGGYIVLNGEPLTGVTSYNIAWKTGELAEL